MPSPWDGSQAEGKPVHPALMDVKEEDLKKRKWWKPRESYHARFWNTIAVTAAIEQCWEWKWPYGGNPEKRPFAYGCVTLNGERILAHRLAYIFVFGSLPDGLFALHQCDNPPCCNPNHLFKGTQTQNMHDCGRKLRFKHTIPDSKVAEVLKLRADGMTLWNIVRATGVKFTSTQRICTGQQRKYRI